MAARKKTTAKRTAPAAAKKAAPKPAPAKKAVAAKPAAAAKPAPKKVAAAAPRKEAPAVASGVEALAKRIVKATTSEGGHVRVEDFYAPDCVSYEPRGDAVQGYEGLAEKGKLWGAMQKRSTWTPLNVAVKGNTILIEWSAEVELRDGRTVTLREVAVHNTRGGKIVEERYYYDPSIFEPPAEQASAPAELPAPRPARRPAPPPPVETHGTPSIDPIDL
jgi:ketosteroid isomerase-like protein